MDDKKRLRLFIALPLSSAVREGIQQFRSHHAHLEQPGFRWLPLENLHITLFFLGPVLAKDIEPLSAALKPLIAASAPLELVFERFSAQPARQPRMLWAQFQFDKPFAELAYGLAKICRPYLLTPDKSHHKPIPHVTIARAKSFAEKPILDNESALPNLTVRRAELWQSETGPKGSVYSSLTGFDFLSWRFEDVRQDSDAT